MCREKYLNLFVSAILAKAILSIYFLLFQEVLLLVKFLLGWLHHSKPNLWRCRNTIRKFRAVFHGTLSQRLNILF